MSLSTLHCSLSYCYSPALNTGLWLVRTCHVTRILGPDWSRLSPDLTRAPSWPQAGDWAGADPSEWQYTVIERSPPWLVTQRQRIHTPGQYPVYLTPWSVASSDKWALNVRIGKLRVLSTILSSHCVIMSPAQDVPPGQLPGDWSVSAPGWRHWLLISLVTHYNKTKSQNYITTNLANDSLVMALKSSDQQLLRSE